MPWWGWIPVGLAAWCALSVVSGLMAGRFLRDCREEAEAQAAAEIEDYLGREEAA